MDNKRKNTKHTQRGRPSRRTIFLQFEAAASSLHDYGGLPNANEARDIWEDIWFVEAHNSTAIEGNTLVLREVKTLLEQNRSVGGRELKDYLEVEGYGRAALWVYSQARRKDIKFNNNEFITLTEVHNIHEQLVSTVWDVSPHPNALPGESAGGFRKHDLMPFLGGMTPPLFTDVPMLMSSFIDDVNCTCKEIFDGRVSIESIPVKLAEIHCAFERIHPFLDGNGRTGRLILNLILVRLGYPPAIILKQRRISYLKALDKADHGDILPLAEIIARSVIDNVNRFITPTMAGSKELVPLRELETKEHSYAMLRQAATRGRLEAAIGADGMWYSTKAALTQYLASKYKRK